MEEKLKIGENSDTQPKRERTLPEVGRLEDRFYQGQRPELSIPSVLTADAIIHEGDALLYRPPSYTLKAKAACLKQIWRDLQYGVTRLGRAALDEAQMLAAEASAPAPTTLEEAKRLPQHWGPGRYTPEDLPDNTALCDGAQTWVAARKQTLNGIKQTINSEGFEFLLPPLSFGMWLASFFKYGFDNLRQEIERQQAHKKALETLIAAQEQALEGIETLASLDSQLQCVEDMVFQLDRLAEVDGLLSEVQAEVGALQKSQMTAAVYHQVQGAYRTFAEEVQAYIADVKAKLKLNITARLEGAGEGQLDRNILRVEAAFQSFLKTVNDDFLQGPTSATTTDQTGFLSTLKKEGDQDFFAGMTPQMVRQLFVFIKEIGADLTPYFNRFFGKNEFASHHVAFGAARLEVPYDVKFYVATTPPGWFRRVFRRNHWNYVFWSSNFLPALLSFSDKKTREERNGGQQPAYTISLRNCLAGIQLVEEEQARVAGFTQIWWRRIPIIKGIFSWWNRWTWQGLEAYEDWLVFQKKQYLTSASGALIAALSKKSDVISREAALDILKVLRFSDCKDFSVETGEADELRQHLQLSHRLKQYLQQKTQDSVTEETHPFADLKSLVMTLGDLDNPESTAEREAGMVIYRILTREYLPTADEHEALHNALSGLYEDEDTRKAVLEQVGQVLCFHYCHEWCVPDEATWRFVQVYAPNAFSDWVHARRGSLQETFTAFEKAFAPETFDEMEVLKSEEVSDSEVSDSEASNTEIVLEYMDEQVDSDDASSLSDDQEDTVSWSKRLHVYQVWYQVLVDANEAESIDTLSAHEEKIVKRLATLEGDKDADLTEFDIALFAQLTQTDTGRACLLTAIDRLSLPQLAAMCHGLEDKTLLLAACERVWSIQNDDVIWDAAAADTILRHAVDVGVEMTAFSVFIENAYVEAWGSEPDLPQNIAHFLKLNDAVDVTLKRLMMLHLIAHRPQWRDLGEKELLRAPEAYTDILGTMNFDEALYAPEHQAYFQHLRDTSEESREEIMSEETFSLFWTYAKSDTLAEYIILYLETLLKDGSKAEYDEFYRVLSRASWPGIDELEDGFRFESVQARLQQVFADYFDRFNSGEAKFIDNTRRLFEDFYCRYHQRNDEDDKADDLMVFVGRRIWFYALCHGQQVEPIGVEALKTWRPGDDEVGALVEDLKALYRLAAQENRDGLSGDALIEAQRKVMNDLPLSPDFYDVLSDVLTIDSVQAQLQPCHIEGLRYLIEMREKLSLVEQVLTDPETEGNLSNTAFHEALHGASVCRDVAIDKLQFETLKAAKRLMGDCVRGRVSEEDARLRFDRLRLLLMEQSPSGFPSFYTEIISPFVTGRADFLTAVNVFRQGLKAKTLYELELTREFAKQCWDMLDIDTRCVLADEIDTVLAKKNGWILSEQDVLRIALVAFSNSLRSARKPTDAAYQAIDAFNKVSWHEMETIIGKDESLDSLRWKRHDLYRRTARLEKEARDLEREQTNNNIVEALEGCQQTDMAMVLSTSHRAASQVMCSALDDPIRRVLSTYIDAIEPRWQAKGSDEQKQILDQIMAYGRVGDSRELKLIMARNVMGWVSHGSSTDVTSVWGILSSTNRQGVHKVRRQTGIVLSEIIQHIESLKEDLQRCLVSGNCESVKLYTDRALLHIFVAANKLETVASGYADTFDLRKTIIDQLILPLADGGTGRLTFNDAGAYRNACKELSRVKYQPHGERTTAQLRQLRQAVKQFFSRAYGGLGCESTTVIAARGQAVMYYRQIWQSTADVRWRIATEPVSLNCTTGTIVFPGQGVPASWGAPSKSPCRELKLTAFFFFEWVKLHYYLDGLSNNADLAPAEKTMYASIAVDITLHHCERWCETLGRSRRVANNALDPALDILRLYMPAEAYSEGPDRFDSEDYRSVSAILASIPDGHSCLPPSRHLAFMREALRDIEPAEVPKYGETHSFIFKWTESLSRPPEEQYEPGEVIPAWQKPDGQPSGCGVS